MNIALVGPGILPIPPNGYGAVEKHIWELSRQLMDRGHQITVLNELIGEYAWAIKVPRLLQKFEIVHAHTSFMGGYLSKFAMAKHLVYTSHSPLWFLDQPGPRERWGLMWESAAVQHADAVIALTGAARKKMQRTGVAVIPNGVDCALFHPRWENRTGVRVCTLGKVVPRKRVHVVAEACLGVAEFHAIGPTPDRDYAREVLRANAHTQFHAGLPESELAELLGSMDVFVHASEAEAMSIAVLEAMASGLPIIFTPSCDEVMGEIGTRVEKEDDPLAYVGPITALLNDGYRRTYEAGQSRARAERKFRWSQVAAQVEAVYGTLAHLSS